MKIADINEAKADFARLVEQAERGEDVLISRGGKPVARLVRYAETEPRKERRRFGELRGKIWIADDFDAPLPEDIMKAFRGEGD